MESQTTMLSDTEFQYLKNFQKVLALKYNKTEQEVLQDPGCLADYRLEIRKVQAQIPAKYRQFTLADITHPQLKLSKEYVQDYLFNIDNNKQRGLAPLLVGPSGTAKSTFGCIILMEALKRGYTAYFTKVDQCIELLTSSWYDPQDKQEFNSKILSVDFLVIDDLGDELRSLNSNLVESTLNKVLRTRLDNLRPTILTSNLQIKDLKTIYDHRIFSILKEHAILIPCNGVDYRVEVIAKRIND